MRGGVRRNSTPRNADREAIILASVAAGERGSEIARRLGISRERVRQIYTRATHAGLPLLGTRCYWCKDRYFGSPRDHRLTSEHIAVRDAQKAARVERSKARFWQRVDKSGGPEACWPWRGSVNPNGYGAVNQLGEYWAHRLAYRLAVGPIEKGMTIDHLCRTPICANPSHLEVVTSRENTLRSPITLAAINAHKTHCPKGHEYTPENTYRRGDHGRWRLCRACSLATSREYMRKRAAQRRAA